MTRALIIFLKYPELGRCKTRLAKTIGDESALKIYRKILSHSHQITKDLPVDKFLYFDSVTDKKLDWNGEYKIAYQKQTDLGGRMRQAFADVFGQDYYKAIIMGTDCIDLTIEIINNAYRQLNHYDVVIGPAKDGGYYLLGLNNSEPKLFQNIEWSTNTVLSDTIKIIQSLGLTYSFMPVLSDIDVEEDLTDELLEEIKTH